MRRLIAWLRRQEDSAPSSPTTEELSNLIDGNPWMTDREREYHTSNQWGR